MRAFACPTCEHLVYFHNSVCLHCDTQLGFDASTREMAVPSATSLRCANASLAGCNWLVAPSPEGVAQLCESCSLTRTRPDDTDADAIEAFAQTEHQKRHLVFQLLELGLPVQPHDPDDDSGLAFDLLSSRFDNVVTGHDDGLITIDLAEADDEHREHVRLELGEAYRTVLGHLRHEVGHYYWDVLVADATDSDTLERFRALFGDESLDYGEAIQRHYSEGAPPDWEQRHVSQYATMHPWEDWAETFAHYLHILDALQTAAAFGISVAGPGVVPDEVDVALEVDTAQLADPERRTVDSIVSDWLALSYALNAMSRSLGNDDLYPFVLAPVVQDKLGFVHDLVVDAQT